MVAKQICDALTLLLEACHIKGVVFLDVSLIESLLYQAVGSGREVNIAHAVDGPQMTHIHGICHLCLLGISLLDNLVCDMPVEIAALVECAVAHHRVEFGIDIAEQYGLRAKGTGEPVAHLRTVFSRCVPYP